MYPDNVDTVTLEIATLASIKDRNKTNISVNPNPINDYMSVEFPDNSIKTLRSTEKLPMSGKKIDAETTLFSWNVG